MSGGKSYLVERWTPLSRLASLAVLVVLAIFAIGPFVFSSGLTDRLSALFVYVILAAMWNALAGYGGLVSVGQQVFFGLGAYFTIRLANAGIDPLVNLDRLINGETGTSLISLNAYGAATRRDGIYWAALAAMVVLLGALFVLLRTRLGAAVQAIRDNEEAAASVGVEVMSTKRIIFVLAALGAGAAGALWLASAVTFQPRNYFSVQWAAYMIFMVLVGGIGTFEGAIIGAVIFFLIETWFGAAGVWYLVGLGATALVFSLFLPRGIWGTIEARWSIRLLPVGYRLRLSGNGASLAIRDSDPVTTRETAA